jgi:hypothetical protein
MIQRSFLKYFSSDSHHPKHFEPSKTVLVQSHHWAWEGLPPKLLAFLMVSLIQAAEESKGSFLYDLSTELASWQSFAMGVFQNVHSLFLQCNFQCLLRK